MNVDQKKKFLENLLQNNDECEWVEFKENFHSPEEIGQNISAISNSVTLHNKPRGYIVFGVVDESKEIVGTSFKPSSHKIKKELLENWLINRLNPRVDFRFTEFDYDEKRHISIIEIPGCLGSPVAFQRNRYIRLSSSTRLLSDFPEKESTLWKNNSHSFEKEIAMENVSKSDIFQLLSTESYFDLMEIPQPSDQDSVIKKLLHEGILTESDPYSITNLGAILLAKNLKSFESVERKSIRVIVYKGTNKVETIREQIGAKGYAIGFAGLVDWINSQLPANEEIGQAFRRSSRMYPEISIRELVANALIHQDFSVKGFPMIEIYSDRIEVSNPGTPLISPDRFIDSYQSRNDKLADLMRRMGYCEEKGSGMDKVFFYNELYQLPPINVIVDETRTRVSLFSYKELNKLDKKEKVRACYQHACLKYVSNEKMTNQSLRGRFNIDDKNYAIASRIIRDTLAASLIKEDDPENKSRKYACYIPIWA